MFEVKTYSDLEKILGRVTFNVESSYATVVNVLTNVFYELCLLLEMSF